MAINQSIKNFKEANKFIPGGVNSPVRSFNSVGGNPLFIKKGKGSIIYDLDDNQYIDYCMSWGALLTGHANQKIIKTVKKAVEKGTTFGAPTVMETGLSKLIIKAIPSIEKIRLVNSGTEAVMSALRLARAFTQKDIIIKFDGCYHGHSDSLLVSAGSGLASLKSSSSHGVPKDIIKNTISIPFNNEDIVKNIFKKYKSRIAAIILEPIPANMGVIIPEKNFLKLLRNITRENNSLLIFDEVITGFRLSLGGAQKIYNINPDLTCLGKIIGGGLPIGAFGGRKEIMDLLAPLGPVYQAGTLSGNPVAVSAGIETLRMLFKKDFYNSLNELSLDFFEGIKEILKKYMVQLNCHGSMFTVFFSKEKVKNYEDAKKSSLNNFSSFYKKLLSLGIYFSPSQFEANFISSAHNKRQLEETALGIDRALYYTFKS